MTRSPSELPRLMAEEVGGWTHEWTAEKDRNAMYDFANPMLRERKVRAGFVSVKDILLHSEPISDEERYRIFRELRWLVSGPVPDHLLDTVRAS